MMVSMMKNKDAEKPEYLKGSTNLTQKSKNKTNNEWIFLEYRSTFYMYILLYVQEVVTHFI